MKRTTTFSLLALVILILPSVAYPNGFQCINPGAPNPLEACVNNTGTPSIYVNQPNGRTYQYFGTTGWGSTVWLDGTNASQLYQTGSFTNGTLFTPVSNTVTGSGTAADPYVITTRLALGSSGVELTQKFTYVNGDRSLRKTWSFSNNGSTTFTDLRFFHGGDSYFGGSDEARSWYDTSTNMVYVNNETFINSGYMGFFANPATPSARYFGGGYSAAFNYMMSVGELPNTTESDFVDAGFSLQWNRASLAPGQTWSFEGFEIYSPPGPVQVLPPASDYTTPGANLQKTFKVHNLDSVAASVNLSTSASPNGWTTTLASAAQVLLNPLEVTTVLINVNVPLNALLGAAEDISLTATSGGTAVGRTRLTILDPQYTLTPTEIALTASSGSSSDRTITLTNGASAPTVQIGSVAGTNPLAAPFTIVSDNCSNQAIAAGGTCSVIVRYTPTGATAANDSFSFPILSPIITAQTISISGSVPPRNVTAAAGTGGTISPANAVVNDGDTQAFIVTASAGYTIASVDGCGGTLVGGTYTTQALTADCAVTATFASNPPAFSVASGTLEILNATSLLKPYPENLKPTAVDRNGNALPVTLVSGETLLSPGVHTLTWRAADDQGVATTIQQTIHVLPTVSAGRDVSVGFVQGNASSFRIALNGPSPDVPLVVNYTVSGYLDGHDLTSGQVQFNAGETEKDVPFTVTATQPAAASSQDVTVALASDLNLGERNTLTVHLLVNNAPPVVVLSAAQAGIERSAFGRSDGPITITANISDPNTADTHTVEWHYPNGAVVQTTNSKLTLQADSLSAGLQRFEAVVMDSGTPVATTSGVLDLALRALPPVIPPGASSWAPSGLPNAAAYQPPTRNVLPEREGQLGAFLIESDPGLQLSMGSRALLGELFQAEVAGGTNGIPADTIVNVGGVFDFVVSDLSTVGQTVRVIVPQRVQIPANAVYRKYDSTTQTWKSFVSSSPDALHSAPGAEGVCPSPGSTEYRAGLNTGDWCVRLTLTDGGPNDGDGKSNGVVMDPGGVAATASVVVTTKANSGGGGAFDWLSVLFGLAVFLLRKVRMRSIFIPLSGIASAAVSAQGWNGGFEVGRVQGEVSTSDMNARLQSAGYNATAEVINRTRTAWRIHGGYQWSRYFGAELGYTDFGEVRTRLTGNVVDIQDFLSGANRLSPHSANGVEVVANGYLPLSRWFALHGRFGVLNWRSSYDAANANGEFQRLHETGSDEFFGAGFEITAWQRWNVSLDYSQYRVDHETMKFPSIGVVFRN